MTETELQNLERILETKIAQVKADNNDSIRVLHMAVTEQIGTIRSDTSAVRSALLGLDNKSGLIQTVKDSCERQEKLEQRYSALAGNFKALIAWMVGAGLFGGSAAAVVSRIIGG